MPHDDERSIVDFLAWEDQQERRHEFSCGRVIQLPDRSARHQRVVHGLVEALTEGLDSTRFDVVASMRVRAGNAVRYPDIVVHPGRVPDAARILSDAVVIIEICNAETLDANWLKLPDYIRLPSFGLLVLVHESMTAPAGLAVVIQG